MAYFQHNRTEASQESDWQLGPPVFASGQPFVFNYAQTVTLGTSPLYFTPVYYKTYFSNSSDILGLAAAATGTCLLRRPSIAGVGTASESCLESQGYYPTSLDHFAPPYGINAHGPWPYPTES
jgi:hypothetical protein